MSMLGGLFGSKPSVPKVAPAPTAPTSDDAAVRKAEEEARRRAAEAQGRASTILTSPLGVESGSTGRRPLLGG